MIRDIYIKTEPSRGKLDKVEAKMILESAESSQYNYGQLESYLGSIGKTVDDFLDELFEHSEAVLKEDWTGCNNFWTSKEVENGIMMVEHTLTGTRSKKGFKSKEELEKEFISIESFLETGNFIGRFFRRTKNIFEEDKEYLPINHSIFALYEKEGTILAVKQVDEKTVFDIIPKRYTLDGNYEYYGEQKVSYDNKKAINKEIVKHLKNYYK